MKLYNKKNVGLLKNNPLFSCVFGNFVLSLFPDKITIKDYG